MKKPNNIAVLMGGQGEEREISIKSGKAIQLALESKGYNYNLFGDFLKMGEIYICN